MGYYTKFEFKARLKKNTPENILNLIKNVTSNDYGQGDAVMWSVGDGTVPRPNIDHEFADCPRWYQLFIISSFKFNTLEINGEFINYGNEIELFIDFITPWVSGHSSRKHVGRYRGEEQEDWTHLHIDQKPHYKRTSEEWAKHDYIVVLDPDGWDRTNYQFSWNEELITREEYNRRRMFSTCIIPE